MSNSLWGLPITYSDELKTPDLKFGELFRATVDSMDVQGVKVSHEDLERIKANVQIRKPSNFAQMGFRVIESEEVPIGEVWVIDSTGKTIKVINLSKD